MDVPPELLVPPEAHGRGLRTHDAALVLDGWLRRLAAQEARCRIVLGRLAHAFLRRRGHHDLGFGRLGDYARERLGLSAREVQSLATVSARLERLPRLEAALVDGLVSWGAGPSARGRRHARRRGWMARSRRGPDRARTRGHHPHTVGRG